MKLTLRASDKKLRKPPTKLYLMLFLTDEVITDSALADDGECCEECIWLSHPPTPQDISNATRDDTEYRQYLGYVEVEL